MAIVVKHLAREFDMSPFAVRETLREHFKHAPHKRWSWENDDAELKKVREVLRGNGAAKPVPKRTKDGRKA